MGTSFSGFAKVDYQSLNAKQREVHNFHFIAGVLASYGYATYPVRDDWNGGDMFARHMLNGQSLLIQLKSRLTFDRKYQNKQLWIAFPDKDAVYVYPHDEVLAKYVEGRQGRSKPLDSSASWMKDGIVHWPAPTKELLELIRPYKLDV